MIDHDRLFKELLTTFFVEFLELFLPVYPVVLLSYDSPKTLETNIHQVTFPHKVVLDFHYHVIQLNQLNWRDFLRQQNPVASALMATMNIAPTERRQVKFECLRLLATLKLDRARMRLISGFIDTYLRLTPQEQKLLQMILLAWKQESRR
jgi:hypothetical protein